MISWKELEIIKKKALERFHLIEKKYPELSMYLVFASRHGRADLRSLPIEIMQEFPSMIADAPERESALSLAKKIKDMGDTREVVIRVKKEELPDKRELLKNLNDKITEADKRVNQLIPHLGVKEDINIEIRFEKLKYEFIKLLQADELVDRERTLQSGASIRIVLGTLECFLANKTVSEREVKQ